MSSSSQIVESWISSFCALLGHEYFAEVSEEFIEDDFNLTGLSAQVPNYKEALEMILDVEPEENEEELEDEEEEEEEDDEMGDEKPAGYRRDRSRTGSDLGRIETSAELLYGLIHQRYITSRPGMGQMHEKYELGHFGSCPRVYCNGCKVLPVGCSDVPGQETVKLFCPSCLDIYNPPNSRFQRVDGAFFGTTFGSLFFMTFPELQIAPAATKQQEQQQQLLPIDPASASGAATEEQQQQQPQSLVQHGSGSLPTSNSQTSLGGASAAAAKWKPAPNQPAEINGVPASNFAPGLGRGHVYLARIYGFRVSERSRAGPRMLWLRAKPWDIRELDEAKRHHAFARGEAMSVEGDDNSGAEDDDAAVDEDGDGLLNEDAQARLHRLQQGTQRQDQRQGQGQNQTQDQVDKRKKAPIRRRRRADGSGMPTAPGPNNTITAPGPSNIGAAAAAAAAAVAAGDGDGNGDAAEGSVDVPGPMAVDTNGVPDGVG